jgi:hypothetical protein
MNRFTNVAQWDKAMEAQGIWNADGSDNKELTSLACHYIKTYAFRINALENPRIKDFDLIVALAKKRNWNLVFNLLAENMQQANTLVGKDLIDIMRSNRDLLMDRYNKNGVVVVDNLEAVSDNEFIDRNWTTEHYAEVGRKIIAKRVAIQIKDLHADQYVNMEYVTAKSATFFNDCEGKQKWNQMSTITSDRAASGTMSSKSGAGNDYSLTFEHPINLVSDSMQVLNVEMKIFQESLDHDAKLTFVCSGQGKENHLVEIPISNFEKAPKDWQTINYSMKLPSDFYNREIVKVFIYNPSKSLIYLDDFKLTFGQ